MMRHYSSLWSNVYFQTHEVTRTGLDLLLENYTKERKPLFKDTGQRAAQNRDLREKKTKEISPAIILISCTEEIC